MKNISKFFGFVLAAALFGMKASFTIDLLSQIFAGNWYLPVLGCAAFDGGVVVWMLTLVYGTDTQLQRDVAGIMLGLDFIGVAVAAVTDVFLTDAKLSLLQALPMEWNRWLIIIVMLIIIANVAAWMIMHAVQSQHTLAWVPGHAATPASHITAATDEEPKALPTPKALPQPKPLATTSRVSFSLWVWLCALFSRRHQGASTSVEVIQSAPVPAIPMQTTMITAMTVKPMRAIAGPLRQMTTMATDPRLSIVAVDEEDERADAPQNNVILAMPTPIEEIIPKNDAFVAAAATLTAQSKPTWQRRDDEDEQWYQRFQGCLMMFAPCSIREIYRRERGLEKSQAVRSSWSQAAQIYEWSQRAAAYDAAVTQGK